jgi:hypothetical protein
VTVPVAGMQPGGVLQLSDVATPELQNAWITARKIRMRSAFKNRVAAFAYKHAITLF